MRKLGAIVRLIGIGLVTAAITQEMRKPAEQRTWNGKVAGFVPYDFRMPSCEKLKETYWNPEKTEIFSEKVFGVGWGINFGRLYKLLRERQGWETCCSSEGDREVS